MTQVVRRAELADENLPDWVLDRVRDRHAGWHAKHPGEAPGLGLVWEWVLDECDLPAQHRRALDVISNLGENGTWAVELIARRVGVHETTLRKSILADLQQWGWLIVDGGPGGHTGARYIVTVPVDEPPNRMKKAGNRRVPVNKGQTSDRANRPISQGSRSRAAPCPPPIDVGSRPGESPYQTGRIALSDRANRPIRPGESPDKGTKGAKDAMWERNPALAAQGAPPALDDDAARFWQVLKYIEAKEGAGIPVLSRGARYQVTRFVVHQVPDERDHTGDDRAAFLISSLADEGHDDPATFFDVVADALGVDRQEARRQARGRPSRQHSGLDPAEFSAKTASWSEQSETDGSARTA